jgi:hypothetical protein
MSGGTQPELRPEDLLALLETVLRCLMLLVMVLLVMMLLVMMLLVMLVMIVTMVMVLDARTYTGQMVGQVASLCANLKRSGLEVLQQLEAKDEVAHLRWGK